MCIIIAKPKHTAMPDMDTIYTAWASNPHGAGIAYQTADKQIKIIKGFMTCDALTNALHDLSQSIDLTATPLIIHLRYTTHGGTCPANCHPFPTSPSVEALQCTDYTCNIALAHNGVIYIDTPPTISDTMQYIATELAPIAEHVRVWWTNKGILTNIKARTASKWAILDQSGEITLIGDFVKDNNIFYSNTTYKPCACCPPYEDTGEWMAVCPLGGDAYIYTPDGELINIADAVDDYGMDEDGDVYILDTAEHYAEHLDGYRAYTSNLMRPRYDQNREEFFQIF